MHAKHFASALIALLLPVSMSVSAGTLLGSWDLRGKGTIDMVYREGSNLRVIQGDGVKKDYPMGNVPWSIFQVVDTDGKPGADIILGDGTNLVIINHASGVKRNFKIGNISWAPMRAVDVDKVAGAEVLVNIGKGIRVVRNRDNSYKDITFQHNGSWGLFAVSDLAGKGNELVLNMGDGVKLIDPRTGAQKDFQFPGYTAIVSVAQLDGNAGLEVMGRTSGDVYVISGGTSGGRQKTYKGGGTNAWAVYGKTADTDGKPGNEIILIMPPGIRIIRHATGASKDYKISSYSYNIDSVGDADGQPGAEIIISDTSGQVFTIIDRTGAVKTN